jgi:hypothetical protein
MLGEPRKPLAMPEKVFGLDQQLSGVDCVLASALDRDGASLVLGVDTGGQVREAVL